MESCCWGVCHDVAEQNSYKVPVSAYQQSLDNYKREAFKVLQQPFSSDRPSAYEASDFLFVRKKSSVLYRAFSGTFDPYPPAVASVGHLEAAPKIQSVEQLETLCCFDAKKSSF